MAVSPSPDQQITGRVVSVNPKGVKLDGHADWFNFSKYAQDLVPPMRDQHVTLTLDRQGFCGAVSAADGPQEPTSDRQRPRAARTAQSRGWRFSRPLPSSRPAGPSSRASTSS